MNIFLSWSGNLSKEIARIFKGWIPGVIQAAKPYYTEDDIIKGTRWNSEISLELEKSSIGLIFLTAENLNAPWVMFEAGALAKKLDDSKVCPILFGITASEVKGPLVQFQAAEFNKKGIKKVIEMLNSELHEFRLDIEVLNDVYEMWWPKLEEKVQKALKTKTGQNKPKKRSERDMLDEILALIRAQSIPHKLANISSYAAHNLLSNIEDVEVAEFATDVEDLDNVNDPNNKDWINKVLLNEISSFDGAWIGRWNGGTAGHNWRVGTTALKIIGNLFYFIINDSYNPYMIIAKREGENRLVGRYFRIDGEYDSTPWVGQIINGYQINGVWKKGRWDFRKISE